MPISVPKVDSDAVDVETTDELLRIVLADGRELAVPLEWFPRLRDASPEQRARAALSLTRSDCIDPNLSPLLQAWVDEALADLIEKRKNTRPRPQVLAAYHASHEKYAELYRKLAK